MVKFSLFMLSCLLSMTLAWADQADCVQEKAFLWRISHAPANMYLFGSIHVFKPEWYPLDAAIEQAFEQADHLAVEIDVTAIDQIELLPKMLRLAMLPDGTQLADYLSDETLTELKSMLKTSNLPFFLLRKMQPWLLEVLLSLETAKKLGYSEKSGIDLYFLRRAKQAQKIILELETVDAQFQALAGSPIAQQVKSLQVTLQELRDGESLFNALLCAWWAGDKEEMVRIGLQNHDQSAESNAVIQRLIDHRNIQMVEKIKGYLNSQGRFFVVVGALHFGGEMGLIALLKKAGFAVQQVPLLRASHNR